MKKLIAILLSVFLLSCFVGNLTFAANPSIDNYYATIGNDDEVLDGYDGNNADELEPTYFKTIITYGLGGIAFGDSSWRVLDRKTGIYYNVTGDENLARGTSLDLNGCAIRGKTLNIYDDSNADEFEPTYFKFNLNIYGTYIWRVLDKKTRIYHNVTGDEEVAIETSMDYNGYAIRSNDGYIDVDIYDENKPTVDGFTYFKFNFSDGTYIWCVLDRKTRIYHNVTGDENLARGTSLDLNRYALRGSDRYDDRQKC